jgi:hypothetical protein
VNSIIRSRDGLIEAFKKEEIQNICPFCGYEWKSYEDLLENFNKQEKTFLNVIGEQAKILNEIDKKIKEEHISPALTKANEYLKKYKKIDNDVINRVVELQDLGLNFQVCGEFDKEKKMVWANPLSFSDLFEQREIWRKNAYAQIKVEKEVFNRIRALRSTSFPEKERLLEELDVNSLISPTIFQTEDEKISLESLNSNLVTLRGILLSKLEGIEIDEEKAEDHENLFEELFNKNKASFQNLTKEMIVNKKRYLDYLVYLRKEKIANLYQMFFASQNSLILQKVIAGNG